MIEGILNSAMEKRIEVASLLGQSMPAKLSGHGPGDLVFELQRENGPPQTVKIAEGLAWGFALEGLRSIIVTHKGEGEGHMSVTVHGRTGSGIRVLPLPKQ